ncbi:hypothetical protein MKW92_009654 [Papaver armeniacum]|nr:hypothetical protein MKW92_009654 [Papaver armeniacum]
MESNAGDDDTSKNLNDFEKANLDEAQESRLLGVGLITFIIQIDRNNQSDFSNDNDGLVVSIIRKVMPRKQPQPDKYTQALRKALMFFNAQRYAIKFNFPQSFAMTMLSWSVIEYNGKYKAAGELNHVKEIIKWGTDYLLKTFDSSADTIDRIYAQVFKHFLKLFIFYKSKSHTSGWSGKIDTPNDHYYWMRPEDMDYPRDVHECHRCSDLAAEMAALGRYDAILRMLRFSIIPLVLWDEFIWGATWLFYATSNTSYLERYIMSSSKTSLVLSLVLLNRLRIFLSPGYPYEDMLSTFNKQTDLIMCYYLPVFRSFKRTKGGLIQINGGAPQPLQFVVQAAFLATLYADYLDAAGIPGWYCGLNFYTTQVMHDFAKTQIDYILGKNPRKMSYVVVYGQRYPKHVHHRAASIPKNKIKYTCEGGWKWMDTKKPYPNTIIGAMVGGLDKHDGFRDVRSSYYYTEPTLAGNAGLVLCWSLYRVKAKLRLPLT